MTEWLLTYLLHSTLVLSLVLLLVQAFKPSAALRDHLLRLALCAPLGTSLLSVNSTTPPQFAAPVTAAAPTEAATQMPQADARPSQPAAPHRSSGAAVIPLPLSKSAMPWALLLLLGSAGWTTLRYGLAWRRLPLRAARPNRDASLQALLNDVTQRTTLTAVRLLEAPVPGPCALGRRTILVPPDLTRHLPPAQVTAVLAHEVAHLVRRDPAWTVALGIITHLLWFQPLNWLALTAWRRASEERCDAWAAHATSPAHLAHALLHLAQCASAPSPSLLSLSASSSHLTVRITALIRPKEPTMTRTPLLLLAGLPFALVTALPPVALAGSASAQPTVILDPGHGGEDMGVVGYAIEKDVTLTLARQLRHDLTQAGIQVIMTRDGDQRLSVLERARLATGSAQLFLSLHTDAAEDATQRGVSASVAPHQQAARTLATRLLNDLMRTTGAPSRGVQETEYTVLTKSKVPAVLLNLGFATNAVDADRLNNPVSQQQLSASIVRTLQTTLQTP